MVEETQVGYPQGNDSKDITVEVGYLAMVSFLEELYTKFEFDQLGGILGGLQLLADGTPADPGMWSDWLRAVDRARSTQPTPPQSAD
jgi:hypothetical protein